jgi:hypothetical protein
LALITVVVIASFHHLLAFLENVIHLVTYEGSDEVEREDAVLAGLKMLVVEECLRERHEGLIDLGKRDGSRDGSRAGRGRYECLWV